MKSLFGAVFAVALLSGCNQEPAPPTTGNTAETSLIDPTPPAAAAMAAPDYLAKAGAGDLFEIESSRAIMAKTDDKAVDDFAAMMVKAHGESTAKVKAAAQSAGLTVPAPALTPDQQAKLDSIKAADGDAAVTAYLAAQRAAHAEALALHHGYAASGDTPALKTAAKEIAPVVQSHIDMLAKLPGA